MLGALGAVIIIGALGIVAIVMLLRPAGDQFYSAGDLWLDEDGDPVELPLLAEPSKVYAADGSLLATFEAEVDRKPVPLDQVPQQVRDAVLAIEDDQFYEHSGVDYSAVVRAMVSNFESGGVSQGGSTITQQVVKNTFLLDDDGKADQTIERKVKEALIAVRLERRFSKDQLLERYLNTVYLGNGTYGLQAASNYYFNKNVDVLYHHEAALLAGLIASPAKWDPYTKPAEAIERRQLVLDRMLDLGMADAALIADASQQPLPTERHDSFQKSSSDYFVQSVKLELLNSSEILPGDKNERYDQIFYGGLHIQTTLDPRLQQVATEVVEGDRTLQRQNITETSGYTAAIASVDTKTGAVLALYGGSDFEEQKFDLATQGKRQTGSTMKVYGLVAALEKGYSPYDIYDGTSGCRYKDDRRSPRVKSGGGPMTLWQGTYKSINCVYVNLVNAVGAQSVVDTAHKLGVKSELDAFGSIILGGLRIGISPLEHASGFSTIASDGVRHETYLISNIKDQTGAEVYAAAPTAEQVIEENTARTATKMMRDVLTKGTAAGKGIGRPAAGKTGTTNGKKDAWFVGFTPQITTAVWVGNPHSSKVVTGQFGGRLPASLWRAYMKAAHEPLPVEDFVNPDLRDYRKAKKVGKFIAPSTTKPKKRTPTTGTQEDSPPETSPPETSPPETSPPETSPPTSATADG